MNYFLDQLKKNITNIHMAKANRYTSKDIKLLQKDSLDNLTQYSFNVKGRDFTDTALVKISIFNDKIRSIYCNCYSFACVHSCEHIPAVIMNYEEFTKENNIQNLSKHILQEFSSKKSNKIKNKLNVEYNFEIYDFGGYHDFSTFFKLKIGHEKLYVLKPSLMKRFIDVYREENGTIEF